MTRIRIFLKVFSNLLKSYKGDSGGPMSYESNGQHILIGDVSYGDGCAQVRPGTKTKIGQLSYFSRLENMESMEESRSTELGSKGKCPAQNSAGELQMPEPQPPPPH